MIIHIDVGEKDLEKWTAERFDVRGVIAIKHTSISYWIAVNILSGDTSDAAFLKRKVEELIEVLFINNFKKPFELSETPSDATEEFKERAKAFLMNVILLEMVNHGLLDRSFREMIKKTLGLK